MDWYRIRDSFFIRASVAMVVGIIACSMLPLYFHYVGVKVEILVQDYISTLYTGLFLGLVSNVLIFWSLNSHWVVRVLRVQARADRFDIEFSIPSNTELVDFKCYFEAKDHASIAYRKEGIVLNLYEIFRCGRVNYIAEIDFIDAEKLTVVPMVTISTNKEALSPKTSIQRVQI